MSKLKIFGIWLMISNVVIITTLYFTQSPRIKRLKTQEYRTTPVKMILLGNSFWNIPDWELGLGETLFQQLRCSYKCFITNDQKFMNQSAAVLFHIHELEKNLPKRTLQGQRWIFFMLESPGWSLNRNYEHWNGEFNWTMTYRRDSDIPMIYGEAARKRENPNSVRSRGNATSKNKHTVPNQKEIIHRRTTETIENIPNRDSQNIIVTIRQRETTILHDTNNTFRENREIISNKSLIERLKHKEKLVAWMVSNCPTQSRRLQYVSELKKYIKVDVYGRCGDMQCPKNWMDKDSNCMNMIARTYKFYLSFENSLCNDYATEKFFKTLPYDIVPVVRGGANYRDFVPPGEKWYIDTADFSSPKDLAEYLLHLDNNTEEYVKYLKSRELYDFRTYFRITDSPAWCELCKKLHDATTPAKVYHNIDQWWGSRDCMAPRDILVT